MTAPNHIIGGITFTGIFGSIIGFNILSDWRYLIVCFVASQLPDVDHTKSLIGKSVLPIAKMINKRYGHRTITHSLVCWLSLSLLAFFLQRTFFPDMYMAQVFTLSYLSHLLFDCMTVMGVPLLYPFKKNPCVLPGNPSMRIRTSSIRQESIVFCVFIVSFIFFQPLMSNGFWTSYNKLFGTMKHLASEYNKSRELLHVEFELIEGSRVDTLSGYCIRASEAEIILLQDSTFTSYPSAGQLIRNINPNPTNKKFEFTQETYTDYTPKQLNTILNNNLITNIRISANNTFQLTQDQFTSIIRSYKGKNINSLYVQPIKVTNKISYTKNKSINTLYSNIESIESKYNTEYATYKRLKSQYKTAYNNYNQETDYVKKEILLEKLNELKEPKPPKSIDEKLQSIRTKIRDLEHQDNIRYQEKLNSNNTSELLLSGTYEILHIRDHIPIAEQSN